MIIGKHSYRSNRGIELSLFNSDPIDMEIGSWEIVAIKALLKLFDLNVVLVGLEISDSLASITILNCHLTIFFK